MHEIEVLDFKIQNYNQSFNELNDKINLKKQELEEIILHQAKGALVRARAKYKIEGEKPTRLFCSLEKHNAVQKHIPKLNTVKNNMPVVLMEQKSIEDETVRYYKDLFSCKDKSININSIEEFLGPIQQNSCPKLSLAESEPMEGLISLDEITNYIKKAKNNKSPGSTGFTNEFYKFFWRDIKLFILNSINHSYQSGMLSVTQRLGIITLIPKGEKDKTFLKNWRPLTLLNTLYKIVSGCISERIKPCLSKIIHCDQKGFVSNRYIGEAVRTTYDIMDWAKNNNKAGIILLIDFEKAYDSISFSYIKKCLSFFKFGESLINWVMLLLKNFSAVINHCGNISEKFDIKKGCRQGDPIASYLFIICIEVLAHKLRSDNKIEAFQIGQKSHLLEIYADDCSIFLKPDAKNLRQTCEILKSFFELSGLKTQVSKTKAIWFGSAWANTTELCPDLKLDWDTDFRLLGIDFDNNLAKMDRNLDDKIGEIRKLFNCWINRTMSPYGKITIIKTLAISKLSHAALVIPTINKNKIKEIEDIMFKFLWNNKPDKVAREDIKLSERAGGMGMIDIKDYWLSFKFSWFRRLCITDSFWPEILMQNVIEIDENDCNINKFLLYGPEKINNIGKKMQNKFWKEVFLSVKPIMQGAIFCYPEKILQSTFWDNPKILQKNKPIKKQTFPIIANKIDLIADFFKPQTTELMNLQDLNNVYGIILDENTFIELQYIIKTSLQSLGLNTGQLSEIFLPLQPLLVNISLLSKKGCNKYYKLLRKKKNLVNNINIREKKWHSELSCTLGINFWNKTYQLTSEIKYENYGKWLQHQIVRNCLFTNYRLSKIYPNIFPYCVKCTQIEQVSHIFWGCPAVNPFWENIKIWGQSLGLNIEINVKNILFGLHSDSYESIKNQIILFGKIFIWKSKQSNEFVTLNKFKHFLKFKLEDIKNSFKILDKPELFDQWQVIFDHCTI